MRTKLSFLAIAVLATVAYAATYLTVDAVMKDTKKYDTKDVTVRGKVANYKKKTSKAGNKYTTFVLKGETKTINVYMQDHMAKDPKSGDIAEVCGIFRVSKKVGTMVFKNEIDASKATGKKYGVKIIVATK